MTVGIITTNQTFFREQAQRFFLGQQLAEDNKWQIVTKEGTVIVRLHPEFIEVDACSYTFNVLVFEQPIPLPFYVK